MHVLKIFILNMKHGIMKISLCYNKSLWFTNPQTCLSKCVSDRYTLMLGYLKMYHTYQFDTQGAHLKDSSIVNFYVTLYPSTVQILFLPRPES